MSDLEIGIASFWDNCHTNDKIESLSGCQYDETIDFLKIRDYINSGSNVLEIGVGLGYVTKGLYDNKIKVSCLEVSSVGAGRVKDYCDQVYLTSELEKLPSDYFDVIICNNVVQHVVTDLLIEELKYVIRSLKVGGVFAVEFVSTVGVEDTGVDPSFSEIQNGGLCRTPEYLEKIINGFGGQCELVFTNEVDFDIVQGHHVFHVTK